jgi:hypothetical protein
MIISLSWCSFSGQYVIPHTNPEETKRSADILRKLELCMLELIGKSLLLLLLADLVNLERS